MSLRIAGGSARGRPLRVPPAGTRPTSERARAGLFDRLATLVDLDGAAVLDLYAGSGAVGLEAVSRGAQVAVLVDSDRRAAQVIRANAGLLVGKAGGVHNTTSDAGTAYEAGEAGAAQKAGAAHKAGTACDAGGAERIHVERNHSERIYVRAMTVATFLTTDAGDVAGAPFNVVFADPPYDLEDDAVASVLQSLAGPDWTAEGAIVVVERSIRSAEPRWPQRFQTLAGRKYGEAMLWYGRAQ